MKKILDKSLIFFFPILIAVFFFQALDVFFEYMPWVFTAYYILVGSYSFWKTTQQKNFKLLFLIWVLYILISGLMADLPIRYMTEEFKRYIAPTLFVFVGMYSKKDDIYRFFLYAIFVSIIIGFFLLLFQPSWYINFLIKCFNNLWYLSSSENTGTIMQTAFRFQSFFTDSYAISYFASFSLCIILCDTYKKNSMITSQRMQIVFLLTFVIAIILSGFRVALSYMVLSFIWMVFYGIFTNNPRKKIYIYIAIVFFSLILIVVFFLNDNTHFSFLKNRLFERLSDLSFEKAMEGSRITQREVTLKSWQNVMLGDGSGSKGAQARIDGLPAITDGGYIKMLVENGVVGTSFFSMIIFFTIRRGLSRIKYYMQELLIIGYVLISMLGANSLSMDWSFMLLFWFAVGRVWNDNIYKKRINNLEEV